MTRWQPQSSGSLSGQAQVVPTTTLVASATLRVALIGDYGMAGEPVAAVAALVDSWQPDFVVTLGDNNYPDGTSDTIDANIGQYYQHYIAPYRGQYGPGASENRFFPVLGNHDWVVGYPEPYLSYFALPGNGRYYEFVRGPLHFFMLDSMPGEPDGITADSVQGQWLQGALAASTARWKLVTMHHPPFSSGHHGSSDWMQWPFAAWGAQLVLAGHDHSYERLHVDGIPYIVNGLGGAARYAPGCCPLPTSAAFFNEEHGALLLEANDISLRLQFVTRAGVVVDAVSL
ncbi:alkaline phosphatase [Candidatus Gracilibacteria bacterium]|nr:alkaline phosphatase [Candidatus Gracilibacteria bacterium]